MTRLEILNEVYGPTEWSSSALNSLMRCMELAQEEARRSMEQAITDPENQPSQFGTVPQESLDNAGLQIECWMGRYLSAKGDLERAVWVLDQLWDKKSGKRITQEWAKLLSKYGEKE